MGSAAFINSFQPGAYPSSYSPDDTPPLVDYWSDSSSDCSESLDTPEFLGSGPKKKTSRKDINTVSGAFCPISSFWSNPPRKNKDLLSATPYTHPNKSSLPQAMESIPTAPPTSVLKIPVSASDLRLSSNSDLQAIDRNALKAVAAAITRDALGIIKEMDLAVLALGVHGRASILYSSSLLKHWVLLCDSRLFPPVSGNIYTLSIDPKLDDPFVVFKILVEDFGTVLFYHSCDQSIFRNM